MKAEAAERKWRAFVLGDLFRFRIGPNVDRIKSPIDGKTAYVTRTEFNNGIDGFTNADISLVSNEYPVITIGNETAKPFVQRYPFFTGTKINILAPIAPSVSWLALEFICVCLEKHRGAFSYSFTANSTRLKALKIMLPVTAGNEPDYAFMEETMREKERAMLERYADRAKRILNEPRPVLDRWKAFPLADIFEISPGVRLTKADMMPGKTPFAGASDSNNGITAFVANRNESLDRDVLGVNYNGSVGENFYHPYEAVFSDDVKRLRVKGHSGGRHVYLFLKVAILKQAKKYQYGYKFNEEHMRRQSLLLPATPDGAPDFAGMEATMRRIEAEQLARYAAMRLSTAR